MQLGYVLRFGEKIQKITWTTVHGMALAEVFCAISDNENIFSCVSATSTTSPQSMRNNLFAFNVMQLEIYVNSRNHSWCEIYRAILTLSLQTTRWKPSSPKSTPKTLPAGGKAINGDAFSLDKWKPNGLSKKKNHIEIEFLKCNENDWNFGAKIHSLFEIDNVNTQFFISFIMFIEWDSTFSSKIWCINDQINGRICKFGPIHC